MRLGQIILDAALMGFIGVWTILAFLASTVATINFFITSNPFEVIGTVRFAAMWLLMIAVLFSPAIGALYWRRRRLRSRIAS
jgi:hypothetical protein